MASWIMVSSRWVAGLSNGRRPVSASITMKSAANARRCRGLTADGGSAMVRAAISPRLVEPAPRASAKIASASVGSASAATVTSRLAPSPPNAEPGSRPASARKNVPSSRRYTTTRRSPIRSTGNGAASTGTRTATISVLANTTNGARWKSHDALRDTTISFWKSLRSSRYGCHAGAPRRFCSRAFSQRISPTTPGARRSARSTWAAAITKAAVIETTSRRPPTPEARSSFTPDRGGATPPEPGAPGLPTTQGGEQRRVEEAFEPGLHLAAVRDGPHEVLRLRMEVDRQILRWAVQLGEDPTQRLREGGRRVLHTRRLPDAATAPGVSDAQATVGDYAEHDGCERPQEHHANANQERRHLPGHPGHRKRQAQAEADRRQREAAEPGQGPAQDGDDQERSQSEGDTHPHEHEHAHLHRGRNLPGTLRLSRTRRRDECDAECFHEAGHGKAAGER